jgi:hypothetical protein
MKSSVDRKPKEVKKDAACIGFLAFGPLEWNFEVTND